MLVFSFISSIKKETAIVKNSFIRSYKFNLFHKLAFKICFYPSPNKTEL